MQLAIVLLMLLLLIHHLLHVLILPSRSYLLSAILQGVLALIECIDRLIVEVSLRWLYFSGFEDGPAGLVVAHVVHVLLNVQILLFERLYSLLEHPIALSELY